MPDDNEKQDEDDRAKRRRERFAATTMDEFEFPPDVDEQITALLQNLRDAKE